jgi:hypothetical protein
VTTRSKLSIGIEGVVADQALGRRARLLEGRNLFVLLGECLAGQHYVDTLDGGDHHLGVFVQACRTEFLDIVDFRERSACARRSVRQELVACLAHQIRPVRQEKNAPEARMSQQPIAQRAGGECLPGARSHLDERPRLVCHQRLLKSSYGV